MRYLTHVADLADAQLGMVSRWQLRSIGVTDDQIRWRIRPLGPWQVVLPGIYATFTGGLTREQWWYAALLLAGDGAVLTGEPALALWGLDSRRDARIPVLLPADIRRSSRKHIMVLRTERMPETERIQGFPVVPPVRATVDACRMFRKLNDVRGLITDALRSPLVDVGDLRYEVNDGQRRGSARLRLVLGEYSAGVRSVAEAQARARLLRLPIPPPLFNVDLLTPDGEFLARPDAYWPAASLAFEVDSRRHHGDMKDWEDTQRRHAKVTARGVTMLHASPFRIGTQWPPLAEEVLASYRIGCTRPPADVRVVIPNAGDTRRSAIRD